MAHEEGNALLTPKTMGAVEGFLLHAAGNAKHRINLSDPLKTLETRPDRKDLVLFARLGEQRAGRDQPRDIIHLEPVQNARNVVIDAMREAADAVAKGIEIAADHSRPDARFERRSKQSAGAAAGNSHTADARGIEVRTRRDEIDRAHDVVNAPGDHGLAHQQRTAGRGLASRLAD